MLSHLREILVVVGSVVALLVGLTTLSNFARNRRRVRIAATPTYSASGASVAVSVVNFGATAVTINFIGWSVVEPPSRLIRLSRLFLYPVFARWIDRQSIDNPRYDVLGEDVDTGPITVTLQHGAEHVVSIPMGDIAGSLAENRLAWPMARDTLEHTWFADRAAPVHATEAPRAVRAVARKRSPKQKKA